MDMVGRQNEQQTFVVPGASLEKQQIAGMPESDHLEKLTELLEQEQFELIDIPTGFTGHTEDRTLRLIYLMNDAVESFLVLKEARLGGLYKKDYEGSLTYSLDREEGEYVLVIHQGDTVCTVFFSDIALDVHLYDYGNIGHFWVKGQENLRVLEYQIAILRDKYEYLGEVYCTEDERKLSSLKNFPPLNYLFYPSVPEQYIVPMEDPWEVSSEAVDVMATLAREVHDSTFLKCLLHYSRKPSKRKAAQLAAMLQKNRHSALAECLADKLRQAASVYSARDFGEEKNAHLQKLWEKAEKRGKELADGGTRVRLYKEEPFVYDCDALPFAVYALSMTKGWHKQKVLVETFK